MAKISVSIPDDLAGELREEAVGNVSRFVSSAVRDALDRRRLLRALQALDAEIGAVDADLLDEAEAAFDAIEAAHRRSTAHAAGDAPRSDTIRVARSRAGRVVPGVQKSKSSKAAVKKPAQPAKTSAQNRGR